MIAQLTRHWWLLALRGLISILFGIAAFILPGVTLVVLVLFFGAYMFVDGVMALISAVRFRHERERWLPLLFEGILGIAVGAVTYLYPGITALAWVYIVAAWALITGVLELVAAIRLRGSVGSEILLILAGIASIALAAAFVIIPLAGLIALVWAIGAYAIVFGALFIIFAFQLRSVASKAPSVPAGGSAV